MPVMPFSDAHPNELYSQQADLSDFIGMDPATQAAVASMPYEFRTKAGDILQQGMTNHVGDTGRVFTRKPEDIVLYVGEGDWQFSMDVKHEL